MRTIRAAATLLLLLFAAVAPQTQSGADIPVRWEGTGTSTYTFEPAVAFNASDWSGSVRSVRQIRVRAKELRRVDVTDQQGRLVGQVVWLADDGTSWSGTVSDTESHLGGAIRFIAEGSGSGGAIVSGLIYHSLTDPNPLADVLPAGTYCLQAALTPVIRYTMTLRERGRRDQVEPQTDAGQLLTGDCRLMRKIGMIRGALTVDSMKAGLAVASMPGEEFLFEGRRALENGVMTGASTRTFPQSPGTKLEASWSIRRRLAIDATMTGPAASWRPKFLGEQAEIKAAINPSQKVTGKFRFTMYDVSRERGVALNDGTATGLDYRFSDDQPVKFSPAVQTSDGWTIETAESLSEASVRIFALDYGAWGRVKAEVNIDGEWYECVASSGKPYVTVPVDENENRIWDTWERNSGSWGKSAAADDDEEPAGASVGDGFSIFEEYRGFKVGDDWVTGDPRTKELFVFDEFGEGVGFFGVSGVSTFLIEQHQWRASDRVVNFNAGYGTRGPQKALHLVSAALDPPGTLGMVSPGVGTPNTVEDVAFDSLEINAETAVGALESVIAHEIGHAVNVPHHGDYRERACGSKEGGITAIWRGAHGGDRGCVMAYPNASHYIGWDGRCYPYAWPAEFGTGFCRARTGTGINAGARRTEDGHPMPVSGDATNGNCQNAIRLR